MQRFDREDAANGLYGNSAAFDRTWQAARSRADVAVTEVIDACISVGVRRDESIATYVAAEYAAWTALFLDERLQRRGRGASAQDQLLRDQMVSQAATYEALYLDRIASRRHDHEQRQGTFLQRLLHRAEDRPLLAWIMIIYLVVTSILGTVGAVRELAEHVPHRVEE